MLSDTRSGSKIRDEKKGTGGEEERKRKEEEYIYIVGEHFEKSPDKFGRGG